MATTNYSWNLPTVGGSEDTWGTSLNANWTALDTLLGGTNATEFAILDGATVTTTELNYISGVTSAVQTQLNTLTSNKADKTTSISAGAGLTGGGDLSTNRTLSHADTSSQGSVSNSGTTFIQSVTVDTYGHITGLTSGTVPSASDPTTAQVLSATAGATATAVGTYMVAWNNATSIVVANNTSAGSNLYYSTDGSLPPFDQTSSTSGTSTLPGTWRAMAAVLAKTEDVRTPTLWLRIS